MDDGLLEHVYGDSVPDGLESVVRDALQAYVTYLEVAPTPESENAESPTPAGGRGPRRGRGPASPE